VIRNVIQFIKQNRDLSGVLDGRRAFVGPELLQIDLTNKCNNNCIACWCRSPLLGSAGISAEVGGQTLEYELVAQTLRDAAHMGTSDVYLAGGGEPFMHPRIMDIIRLIKELGFRCHVNTNFTLVDEERAAQLQDYRVDNLIVSLWAATPKTYVACHPNQTVATFERLFAVLDFLVKRKQGGGPHIKLYNVIMSRNYHEVVAMARFACELGVDAVEYTVADVIPGYTDELLLTAEQRREIVAARAELDELQQNCCPATALYYGEFMRRLQEDGAARGDYDPQMLTDIPCLIGWNFSRLLADGNINGCLKAHRIPVGNVHDESFGKIWHGATQGNFRQKTLEGNPEDPFFSMIGNDAGSKIGCFRGCDDIERNRRLYRRLQALTPLQRLLLKAMGYLYRLGL